MITLTAKAEVAAALLVKALLCLLIFVVTWMLLEQRARRRHCEGTAEGLGADETHEQQQQQGQEQVDVQYYEAIAASNNVNFVVQRSAGHPSLYHACLAIVESTTMDRITKLSEMDKLFVKAMEVQGGQCQYCDSDVRHRFDFRICTQCEIFICEPCVQNRKRKQKCPECPAQTAIVSGAPGGARWQSLERCNYGLL